MKSADALVLTGFSLIAVTYGMARFSWGLMLPAISDEIPFSPRFGNVGMELFDLRQHDKETVLEAVLAKCTTKFQLTYADRALQFLRTFIEAREKENYFEIPAASSWSFIRDESAQHDGEATLLAADAVSFAFQPIVDPLTCEIVSLEALLHDPQGELPLDYFSRLSLEQIYQIDFHSKKTAFDQAKQLGIEGLTLSISLLPMSLVEVPGAMPFLLNEIVAHELVPEQIMVEFTENEVISRLDEFEAEIKQLKAAGISLLLSSLRCTVSHYYPVITIDV